MLFKRFTDFLPKLMKHKANHSHQYQVLLTELKNNLTDDILVFHIEFSENYACKLNVEIKSFYFGGSWNQINFIWNDLL